MGLRRLVYVSRGEWGGANTQSPFSTCAEGLQKPTPYVALTHTATPTCLDHKACCGLLKRLQKHFRKLNMPDLPFNFMVGPQGRVYEGWGWDANSIPYMWKVAKQQPFAHKASVSSFVRQLKALKEDKMRNAIGTKKEDLSYLDEKPSNFYLQYHQKTLDEANRLRGKTVVIALLSDCFGGKEPGLIEQHLTALDLIKHGVKTNHIAKDYKPLYMNQPLYRFTTGNADIKYESDDPYIAKKVREYRKLFDFADYYQLNTL